MSNDFEALAEPLRALVSGNNSVPGIGESNVMAADTLAEAIRDAGSSIHEGLAELAAAIDRQTEATRAGH